MQPITGSCDPHFTRNDIVLIEEAEETTFDIFDILLKFCAFPVFLEISKILKTRY